MTNRSLLSFLLPALALTYLSVPTPSLASQSVGTTASSIFPDAYVGYWLAHVELRSCETGELLDEFENEVLLCAEDWTFESADFDCDTRRRGNRVEFECSLETEVDPSCTARVDVDGHYVLGRREFTAESTQIVTGLDPSCPDYVDSCLKLVVDYTWVAPAPTPCRSDEDALIGTVTDAVRRHLSRSRR